jgi:hypothetical protein
VKLRVLETIYLDPEFSLEEKRDVLDEFLKDSEDKELIAKEINTLLPDLKKKQELWELFIHDKSTKNLESIPIKLMQRFWHWKKHDLLNPFISQFFHIVITF